MKIKNYRKISHIPCIYEDKVYIAIRAFESGDRRCFLIVDINRLATRIVEQKDCKYRKNDVDGRYFSSYEIESSLYYQSLKRYNVIQTSQKNQGVTQIYGAKGIFLSIDMCPSIKKIETRLFDELLNITNNGVHINILIAISGLWIVTHQEDMRWLQDMSKKNIHITWVNHSFSHMIYKDVAFNNNFLLLPNTDIEAEILETERLLIENGEVPAPFFRFPGLISDQAMMQILNAYGLIQLGANAWLTEIEKNYQIKNGDIILVHGNGNENEEALDAAIGIIQSKKYLLANLQEEMVVYNKLGE